MRLRILLVRPEFHLHLQPGLEPQPWGVWHARRITFVSTPLTMPVVVDLVVVVLAAPAVPSDIIMPELHRLAAENTRSLQTVVRGAVVETGIG